LAEKGLRWMGPGFDELGSTSMSRNGCGGLGTGKQLLGGGFYRLRIGLHELGISLDGLPKNCRGRDMGLDWLGRVGMVGELA
jgi:hypothetical protein